MAPGSDKIDDLNAIDEAWADLGREIADGSERPPAEKLPAVNVVEPIDPEIDALLSGLDALGESPDAPGPPPEPVAPTPPPGKPVSRSLMPPYVPPARPPSRPSVSPPKRPPSGQLPSPPERPARPASRPAMAAAAGSTRTLLAFGPPAVPTPASLAKTPPIAVGPMTPIVSREPAPTPVVTILDGETGEAQSPALTLDLAEMDNPIRKPSAPRVPIDLSDFDASFDAAVADASPLGQSSVATSERPTPRSTPVPILAPPPEPAIAPAPPAVAEPRRTAPTPDEITTTPMRPEEAVGFERELDLPTEPGVAKEFELDGGGELDALGAVERAAAPESVVARMEREMTERFDAGDFTAALESAEWILRDVPDHPQARRTAASCREVLLQMYAARLGSLDRVPRIVVGPQELKNLGLDHRAGFVLSCIDGHTTFADVLDLSGMPPLESYRILCDLILAHVIAVR